MPRDEEVIPCAGSVWAMTGLTAQQFTSLLPPFEYADVASIQDYTTDGQPRTSRCILTNVKQKPIQQVQGRLFEMSQSKANQWIHLLPTVLKRTLPYQAWRPARTADELAIGLTATQT